MDKVTGKVIIRRSRKRDFDESVEIFREGFSICPYCEKWTEKNARSRLKRYFNRGYITYIAEVDKKVAGFIMISTFLWDTGVQGFIDEFVVAKKFRGRGIGRLLLDKAEDYFRKKNIKEISLYSDRRSDAARIYEKKGYKQGDMIVYSKKIK